MSYRYTEEKDGEYIEHIVAGRIPPNLDTARPDKLGISKPDDTTIKIDVDGTLHALTPIPITREAFDALEPEEKRDKMFSIIDDYNDVGTATLEEYGFVKLSTDNDITENEGLALSATEKNPEVEGSMANEFNKSVSNITTKLSELDNAEILCSVSSTDTSNSVTLSDNISKYRLLVLAVCNGSGNPTASTFMIKKLHAVSGKGGHCYDAKADVLGVFNYVNDTTANIYAIGNTQYRHIELWGMM